MPPSSREALRELARTRAKLIDAAMLVVADGKGTGVAGWRMLVAAIDAARAADKAWNERERLVADFSLEDAASVIVRERHGMSPSRTAGKVMALIDAHLFGTPTSGDTPDGNPTAEVQPRGSGLSPSSVTPRACEGCRGSGVAPKQQRTDSNRKAACRACGGSGEAPRRYER